MLVLCITLEVIGFVTPISAAVVAYRRYYPHMPDPSPGAVTTYDDVDRWMKHDIPEMFRSRRAALKWPALWAAFGLACSTASGVLSMLFLSGN
ncbi:hypothetical protein [Arthrobacter celericrescens]|uniref:hypothetical protein n=1 Tax=Arthrobacter celericrescens TaxID=2320851 RepID=UPI0013C4AB4B|nr:hypothetical protein [Arthrobacter celericrescens]